MPFKGRFIATLAYNNTDDIISQIIKPLEGSGGKIRYLTPDNVSRFKKHIVVNYRSSSGNIMVESQFLRKHI